MQGRNENELFISNADIIDNQNQDVFVCPSLMACIHINRTHEYTKTLQFRGISEGLYMKIHISMALCDFLWVLVTLFGSVCLFMAFFGSFGFLKV